MTQGAMRFLLPHERWFARWILERQRTRRTTAVGRMEQQYGPQAMIWMNASLANLPFGVILARAILEKWPVHATLPGQGLIPNTRIRVIAAAAPAV